MRESRRWRRQVAAMSVVALAITACGGGDEPEEAEGSSESTSDEADDGDDGDGGGEDGEIATDVGATEEPCPEAVNEDNGCIYLGTLSDLTEGPFAALGVQIVEGQEAFWNRVNEDGGIGGYDINVSEYVRDNKYNPQEQTTLYREIEPDILALAQSLGTPPTLAIIDLMDEDDMVANPATWWSGWSFEEADAGLVMESGASYCLGSMIALDWYSAENSQPSSVLSVGYPGDYGGDAAAGARAWAEANDAEYGGFTQTAPNALAGNQDAPVQAIVQADPDVVVLGTGPAEAGEIVGTAVAQGYEGIFLGSTPTWDSALMESAAAPALESQFFHFGTWEAFDGESEAHAAMQEALGEGEVPENDGYTFGWIWSYPLLAALESAAEAGDLTRAGVREAASDLEVDYEGALPTATFGGDANETAVRTGVMSQPDSSEELGLATLETEVESPTAEDYDYSEPCVAVE